MQGVQSPLTQCQLSLTFFLSLKSCPFPTQLSWLPTGLRRLNKAQLPWFQWDETSHGSFSLHTSEFSSPPPLWNCPKPLTEAGSDSTFPQAARLWRCSPKQGMLRDSAILARDKNWYPGNASLANSKKNLGGLKAGWLNNEIIHYFLTEYKTSHLLHSPAMDTHFGITFYHHLLPQIIME